MAIRPNQTNRFIPSFSGPSGHARSRVSDLETFDSPALKGWRSASCRYADAKDRTTPDIGEQARPSARGPG